VRGATIFETTFGIYEARFSRLVDYIAAVMPGLVKDRRTVPVFVESMIVLIIAWHEDFLSSLVAQATRARESAAREYFVRLGRKEASNCALRDLMIMAKSRVDFRERGRRIEVTFIELLGFRPWPGDDVRDKIVDLNLLRQLVVHHTSGTVGDDYWIQFVDKTLLATTQYGDLPAVRRVAHDRVLVFIKEAIVALKGQADHLRAEMLRRPEWVYESPSE
jgi:hypothetical protein